MHEAMSADVPHMDTAAPKDRLWRALIALEPLENPGQETFSFTVPGHSDHLHTLPLDVLPGELGAGRRLVFNRRYLHAWVNLGQDDPTQLVFENWTDE
jgi:hypothetical protein